jgi:hypothetical protein
MQVTSTSTVTPSVAGNSSTLSGAGAPSATAPSPVSAPAQSEAAAVSAATSTLDSSVYSTSVGGKSYSANISQADGTYTLSVPNLPGASVTASSLSGAEIALGTRIDVLV